MMMAHASWMMIDVRCIWADISYFLLLNCLYIRTTLFFVYLKPIMSQHDRCLSLSGGIIYLCHFAKHVGHYKCTWCFLHITITSYCLVLTVVIFCLSFYALYSLEYLLYSRLNLMHLDLMVRFSASAMRLFHICIVLHSNIELNF